MGRAVCFGIAALLLFAVPAFAQSDENKGIAEVERSVELYKQGQFKEAGEGFLRAYLLVKRPVQLRNAAKSFEQASLFDDALRIWEQFRDHSGVSAEDVGEARAHIEMIRARQREQAALIAAEAAKADAAQARAELEQARARADAEARARREAEERSTPEVKTPPPLPKLQPIETKPDVTGDAEIERKKSPPLLGFTLLGAGFALGVASVVVFVLTENDASELHNEAQALVNDDMEIEDVLSLPDISERESAIGTRRTISLLLAIGGAASIGSGLYFVLQNDAASLEVAPTGAGAKATLRW